ncbi:MAG: 2-hydroxyacyl-CoA dehydratase family protein [Nitrososphaerales archaeon]|nr:2-hydroxyacyl-CoA dehydratase family protein [Nitrososphaerales archaeon]
MTDYKYAIESGQVDGVVYVNVACNGRVGLSYSVRKAVREFGFRLLTLD